MLLKVERILNRLGSGIGWGLPRKPKGMHRQTYERLQQEASEARRASLYTVGGRLKRDLC